jgi:hypothetical protein
LAHLAVAAALAMAIRFFRDNFMARALPPFNPHNRAKITAAEFRFSRFTWTGSAWVFLGPFLLVIMLPPYWLFQMLRNVAA